MCGQICSLTCDTQLTVLIIVEIVFLIYTDRTFEINLMNSGDINPPKIAPYDHQYEDKQCNKEQLKISGFGLVIEQSKDKELVQLNDRIQSERCYQQLLVSI